MNTALRSLLCASLAGLGFLAFTGCLKFKPTVDSTRYFALATAPPPPASTPPAVQGIRVGLRLLSLPSYLDDTRLALRKGPHEIRYSEGLLWAERPDQGLPRVLAANLAHTDRAQAVYLEDWSRTAVDFEVYLEVSRFEPDHKGLVTLEAAWRITRPGRGEILRTGTSLVQKQGPPLSADPEGAVASLSAALADFSVDLTEVLQALPLSESPPK